jgi:hypothetical protein
MEYSVEHTLCLIHLDITCEEYYFSVSKFLSDFIEIWKKWVFCILIWRMISETSKKPCHCTCSLWSKFVRDVYQIGKYFRQNELFSGTLQFHVKNAASNRDTYLLCWCMVLLPLFNSTVSFHQLILACELVFKIALLPSQCVETMSVAM